MNLREVEMSPLVHKWLIDQGCKVYPEAPHYGACVDFVGEKEDGTQICVEMKVVLCEQLFRQCLPLQCVTAHVYGAVRPWKRTSFVERFKKFGIGILIVHESSIEVYLEPSQNIKPLAWHRIKTERLLQGDTAGRPQLAGDGPAQDCFRRVREYRAANPSASWKQIFQNVENHYCSHTSMAQALKRAEFLVTKREAKAI